MTHSLRIIVSRVVVGLVASVAVGMPAAQAQQTSTVSSLFLSNGAELDFGLYGMNGGAGTNGANSDRIAVQNQFNFSSASPGTYLVGFSHDDTVSLTPGTVFTLVNFGSTNFTAADAPRFTAIPRGTITEVTGTFILNTTGGGPGTLQFQLTSTMETPEPAALPLVALAASGTLLVRVRTRRKHAPPRPSDGRPDPSS